VLRASSDIAEAFNSHLTRIGEDLANKIPNSDVDPLTYVKQTNSSFSFHEIAINDGLTLLRKIATNKATGLDKIPSKLLTIGGDTLAPSLTARFNRSLPTGIFHDWKKASVASFQEWLRVYLNTIYYQIASQNFGHCTVLLEATNNWCVNIDKGLRNWVIFINLKKAFDTISHEIVFQKLVKYGLNQNSVNWFTFYLSSRNQQCSVNGHLSADSQINCGIPQGSLIGPLLFLLYINDLLSSLDNATAPMNGDGTSISFAAPTNYNDLEMMINTELANINT